MSQSILKNILKAVAASLLATLVSLPLQLSQLTQVYARATRTELEQAIEKLTEPWGQVIEFEKRAG